MGSHHQPPTLIVIDALDECVADHAPEKILAALASQLVSVPFLRVFVTSRPTSSTEDAFAHKTVQGHQRVFLLHKVERDDVDADIRKYLFHRLGAVAELRGVTTRNWPPAILVEKLVENADSGPVHLRVHCSQLHRGFWWT